MCMRIWLEVGHACEPRRSPLGRALALDWRVWVKGASGQDISPFVHKVVFYLHPASAFVYPKRVIQAPPYEIQESGCASIEIPIHVYLKHSERPRRIRLRYSLCADSASRSCSESRTVFYDIENPSEPLLVVLLDREKQMKPNKYKFAEPAEARKPKRCKGEEACEKCAEVGAQLRKQLKSALTEDEVARVWRLCAAVARYEKSAEALPLPPFSDPIYRLPELPASLRASLTSVEADLARQ
ncbi:YEATS family domain-containing protein [Phthorimaea operculella]|nr:YEATS family domain-containing protein [Phthorimaea operculella]